MARVRSVGAIATVNPFGNDAAGGDPTFNVHLRMFAKLDVGLLAIDPAAQTAGFALPHRDVHRIPEKAAQMLGVETGAHLPPGIRAAHWARIVEVLAKDFEVGTDVETLMALPFDLVPDGELRELLKHG